MKPLAIELYAGLHGWAEGLVAEGFRVYSFDIVDMCALLGQRRPKGCELILQDVCTLHGSQFKDALLIVASPPCQQYSYRAMPWSRARSLPPPDNSLFDACFRIHREASAAAGRYIPLIVENVCGAQKWVGRARWHFGSYYLWGDVPALMPITGGRMKWNPDGISHPPGSWFRIADSKNRGARSQDWNNFRKTGDVSPHWRLEAAGIKLQSPGHYLKPGSGADWFDGGSAAFGSNSKRRAAAAFIAKIPFPLAQYIARVFRPSQIAEVS